MGIPNSYRPDQTGIVAVFQKHWIVSVFQENWVREKDKGLLFGKYEESYGCY